MWLTCDQLDLFLPGGLKSPLQGRKLQKTTGWQERRVSLWHCGSTRHYPDEGKHAGSPGDRSSASATRAPGAELLWHFLDCLTAGCEQTSGFGAARPHVVPPRLCAMKSRACRTNRSGPLCSAVARTSSPNHWLQDRIPRRVGPKCPVVLGPASRSVFDGTSTDVWPPWHVDRGTWPRLDLPSKSTQLHK